MRDLFFVGKAAERRLWSLGIRTIGDLAHTDPQVLSRVLKKHGEVLWRYANGIDDSPVEIEPADAKGWHTHSPAGRFNHKSIQRRYGTADVVV